MAGGFAPHIDAVAYTHIKDVKHLTILLSVDPSNMANGGLEVVDASHDMTVPINEKSHCIEADWVSSQKWVPVELEAGKRSLPFLSDTLGLTEANRTTAHLHLVPCPPQRPQHVG